MRNKLLLIGFLFTVFFIYAPNAFAANVYWYGGTGTWSDYASHWSNNSGDIPSSNHGAAPGTDDNAIFDTLSNATAYTVTINAAATCANFSVAAPLTSGVVTISISSALAIWGNYTLVAGTILTNSNTITFSGSSGTALVTTNGVVQVGTVTINCAGRTVQLQDNLTFSIGQRNLNLLAGTFDPQTYTVTINPITAGPQIILGAWSFYNLILNSSAVYSNEIKLDSNITVTNTLTLAGNNNTTQRLLLSSTVRGVQRKITITGTTGNAYSNIDFQDIDLYDAAGQVNLSAITGLSGDGGGNNATDMLLTSSQAQYWKHPAGASANWSSLNWYDSGLTATSTNRVPLPQDDVYFITGSFGAGKTLTMDTTNMGRNVSFTNADNNPALAVGSARIFGSLAWGTMTFVNTTCTFTFMGRSGGNLSITTNGLTNATNLSWTIDTAVTTTYIFADAFNMGFVKTFTLTNGTFDASDQTVSVGAFMGTAGTLYLGNGTWSITGAAASWAMSTAVTLYSESSTIKFIGTPTANVSQIYGGKTYNIVWYALGSSTYNITINTPAITHTFAELKDTGTAAHSLIFTAGQTISVGAFTVSGSAGNVITLDSSSLATFALTKTGGGTVCSDYLNIQHSVATPANTWYAGANSTNNQAVATVGSGWNFTAPPIHPSPVIFKESIIFLRNIIFK